MVSNWNCSEGQLRADEVTEGRIMKLMQQWRYLNLARNSFYSLFPAKYVMSYGQIIFIRLYGRLNSGSWSGSVNKFPGGREPSGAV